MNIKQEVIYKPVMSQADIVSISNTINILYQFKNFPEAWEAIKKDSKLSICELQDAINLLVEIGGEDYQLYNKKIHKKEEVI